MGVGSRLTDIGIHRVENNGGAGNQRSTISEWLIAGSESVANGRISKE